MVLLGFKVSHAAVCLVDVSEMPALWRRDSPAFRSSPQAVLLADSLRLGAEAVGVANIIKSSTMYPCHGVLSAERAVITSSRQLNGAVPLQGTRSQGKVYCPPCPFTGVCRRSCRFPRGILKAGQHDTGDRFRSVGPLDARAGFVRPVRAMCRETQQETCPEIDCIALK